MSSLETTWHGHYTAVFVTTYGPSPVMHLWENIKRDADGHSLADITMCGRVVSTYLAFRHAAKFARKCATCDSKAQQLTSSPRRKSTALKAG